MTSERALVAVPLLPVVDAPDRSALLVDFDGSLSPIVLDPSESRILPSARAALARLVPDLARVAVVSGRPAQFLHDALDLDDVELVGQYGLERVVDGQVVVDERVAPYVDVMGDVADRAERELPGVRVERKGDVAVTLHWREQPEVSDAVIEWATATAAASGLDAPLRGRMALELRPPIPVDKGTAVTRLARGMHAAVFAGDDAGDLPAFAALRRLRDDGRLVHAVSIGVQSDESPPEIRAADVVVDGPRGLAALLDSLADVISARG